MSETLVINNVDLNLLEDQRHGINRILFRNTETDLLAPQEAEALQGIYNMLERWSDIRYYDSCSVLKPINLIL